MGTNGTNHQRNLKKTIGVNPRKAYPAAVIRCEEMLEQRPVFKVDQYNWGGEYRPAVYGQLAILRNQAFFLRMTCEEKPPVCVTTSRGGPVWEDSAMEFFLQMPPLSLMHAIRRTASAADAVADMLHETEWESSTAGKISAAEAMAGKPLNLQQPYINLEVNAAGILHAGVGANKSSRRLLPEELYRVIRCRVDPTEESWTMSLMVPFAVTDHVYDFKTEEVLRMQPYFFCNFYKISEKQPPVHFGSFTEIRTPAPDFHQPAFFAVAEIRS